MIFVVSCSKKLLYDLDGAFSCCSSGISSWFLNPSSGVTSIQIYLTGLAGSVRFDI